MKPRQAAFALAAGRVALGVAVLVAPERVTSKWLGAHASHPTVRYLARSLGARDLALGVLALKTLDDRRLGPSVVAACAIVDALDALATVAARSDLPSAGVVGTVVVAGGAAGAGVYLSRRLAT